jgi:hypothetical protein
VWQKDADARLWSRRIADRRRSIAIRMIIAPVMVIPMPSVLQTAVVMSFHTFMVISEGRQHI